MDYSQLRTKVRDSVLAKIESRMPFTTGCISHPIIETDNTVRHREVRDLINEMHQAGEIEDGAYVTSPITVTDTSGKQISGVRLFHPDDYDSSEFTETSRALVRGVPDPSGRPARALDVSDDDGPSGDCITVIASTGGNPVGKQCEATVQLKNDTLNVPRSLIMGAGFAAGDKIRIAAHGSKLTIRRGASTDDKAQVVDAEGRIRLYGENLTALNRQCGEIVAALLVEPSDDDKYIEIQ